MGKGMKRRNEIEILLSSDIKNTTRNASYYTIHLHSAKNITFMITRKKKKHNKAKTLRK